MLKRIALAITLFVSATSVNAGDDYADKSIETHKLKGWWYGCNADLTDQYGEVFSKRTCGASKYVNNHDFRLFDMVEGELDLGRYRSVELCDSRPLRVAVDGVRVDTLPRAERLQKVLTGKKITREVWIIPGWPECSMGDEEASLTGAKQIWDELVKLKVKIYDPNIAKRTK